MTAFVDLLGGPAPALLVVAFFLADVFVIATVVWHGILSRMAKGTNKSGNKRGKDHSTTKPVRKTDGRLKRNGGGKS